jgi:hypothetical protein
MKKYLLLLGIVIISQLFKVSGKNHSIGSLSHITTSKGLSVDTIRYLQDSIITFKHKFQHKPLSSMLKTLHLPVKSYLYHIAKPGGPITNVTLFFDNTANTSQKLNKHTNVPIIVVYFENDIPRNKTNELWSKSQGEWLIGEKEFYGAQLIKNIEGLSTGKK